MAIQKKSSRMAKKERLPENFTIMRLASQSFYRMRGHQKQQRMSENSSVCVACTYEFCLLPSLESYKVGN